MGGLGRNPQSIDGDTDGVRGWKHDAEGRVEPKISG